MIAAFVIDKMSRYLNGGAEPETAAHHTRGELAAIYKGDHYSRDESGAMRATPPPESLDPETAMAKCDAMINELLKICEESAGKGAPLNVKPASAKTHGKAPEAPSKAHETESGANKGNGLDGLKNYVRGKTA